MADPTHYTLHDLESFALERCALGLRILSDKSQYEFERKVVFQESTMTARECDLLYVAYYYNRPNDRVYADLDYFTGQVFYYDGQKDVNISAASEARKIDPESACFAKELRHLEPFSGVANLHSASARGSRRAPKSSAQVQNRSRLTILIKFAYLLTGRVKSISPGSQKQLNVRGEFAKMCTIVQKREDHNEKAVKKEPVNPKNILGGMSGNSGQPTMHNAWSGQPQDSSEGSFALAIRATKRKIVDLTISDNEEESSMQGPQIKRRAELDISRASLHPGLGSNDYSMIDELDETGGVSLTNNMIEPSRAPQAGPSSLEQRCKTVTKLPERPVTPLDPDLLRAARKRAERAERDARQAAREVGQAKLEAELWKGKFKKLMGTKVSAFLDAI